MYKCCTYMFVLGICIYSINVTVRMQKCLHFECAVNVKCELQIQSARPRKASTHSLVCIMKCMRVSAMNHDAKCHDPAMLFECLSTEVLIHMLQCAKDESYMFMWRTTTAFLMCSKHTMEAVNAWRSTVTKMDFLPKQFHILHKRLSTAEINKLRMSMVQKFPNVDTLIIDRDHDVFDADLKGILSHTPHLKKLDLGHCGCVNKEAVNIICSKLPHLKSLKIYGIVGLYRIDDQSMNELAKTYDDQMETLMLNTFSGVTNTGIKSIADKNPSLRELMLSHAAINDAGVTHLVNSCTRLEYIDLTGSLSITNASVVQITETCAHYLKTLKLAECISLTEEAFVKIEECGILHTLDVRRCCHVDDAALNHIAKCHTLRNFNMSYCNEITEVGTKVLASGCFDLQIVRLEGCEGMNNNAVLELTSKCAKLEYIVMSELGKNIKCDALENIGQNCAGLKYVDLSGCKDVHNEALKHLAKCKLLEELVLCGCTSIGNKGVLAITTECKHLKYLNLKSCRTVSNPTIQAIKHKTLEYVNLMMCHNITDWSVQELINNCPNFKCDFFEQRIYTSIEDRNASLAKYQMFHADRFADYLSRF